MVAYGALEDEPPEFNVRTNRKGCDVRAFRGGLPDLSNCECHYGKDGA